MRTSLICNDTRGGIQPYLALALGLKAAGDDVSFVAPEGYAAMARETLAQAGIPFHGLPGDVETTLQQPEVARQLERGFWATHRLMIEHATQAMCDSMRAGLAAMDSADRIIGGFGGMLVGESIAEALRIPFIQAHLQPLTTTGEYPGLLAPGWLPRSLAPLNRFTHALSRQVFWQAMRPALNTARRTILNLPPIRFWGNVGRAKSPDDLLLYGYSTALLPQPKDWPAGAHVTGYWFLDRPATWQPPIGLESFLEAGPPPVVVGFGSMSSRNAEAMTELVLSAIRQTGQRVVLLSGWGGLATSTLPDWAFALPGCPHDWLFPRCSLAIHHGGAGTTGAALRAGIPSLIVPFAADQFFWGRRIAEQGFGLTLGSRKSLTAPLLAHAIGTILGDEHYTQRTRTCATHITAENGVSRAVKLLSDFQ